MGFTLPCTWYVSFSAVLTITNRLLDHSRRPRHTRTTQTFPRTCAELQGHWMLCTNRTRSWIECARIRDNRNMEPRGQDLHPTFPSSYCIEMVDRISWTNSKSCRGNGSIDHCWKAIRTSSIRLPDQRYEDPRTSRRRSRW